MSKVTFQTFAKLLLAIIIPAFMSACASNLPFTSKTDTPLLNTFTAEGFSDRDYEDNITQISLDDIFKVGDTADVTVHGFDSFSGSYTVDRTGRARFVHIGDLQVAGISITDLQNTLQQRYTDCCLQNPSVSIKKDTRMIGTIVVDGAVDKPGAFELSKTVKLSEAIALAGGATLDADRKQVVLAREINNERRIMTVNLDDVHKLGAYDPVVYPNDVIFLQDSAGRLLYNDFVRVIPVLNSLIFLSRR